MKSVFTIVSVLVFVVLSLTACQRSDSGNAQIAENWIAAWNSHDVEKVMPLFTEDVLC